MSAIVISLLIMTVAGLLGVIRGQRIVIKNQKDRLIGLDDSVNWLWEDRRMDAEKIGALTFERDSTAYMLEHAMAQLPEDAMFNIFMPGVAERQERAKAILAEMNEPEEVEGEPTEVTNVVPITSVSGRIPAQRTNGEAYFKQQVT